MGGAHDAATGSWLALLGNPSRSDLTDADPQALSERLLRECLGRGVDALSGLSPPFAAILHDGRTGTTEVAVDRCGLQHLYLLEHPDGTIWISSSSLALAAGLGVPLDPEGIVEWLGIGHFISQRTFFRGLRKLGCGERLTLSSRGIAHSAEWGPEARDLDGDPLEEFVGVFSESAVASATGDPVAVEITGGLDSRLVLAALLDRERPFFGWTIGRPDSAELRTVARLRARVPFQHLIADVQPNFVAELPVLVPEFHELSDGEVSALEYAPLLIAFDQLAGRRTTSVSGSGGETARGYYYGVLGHGSGPRGVPVGALAQKVARDTGSLRLASKSSLLPQADDPVVGAIEHFIANSPAADPTAILDDFYLRARMQRFGGRNITTTGLFCRQGLPYFANEFVDLVFSLPNEQRADGRLLRQALQTLSPALAAVNLDSGVPVRPGSARDPGVRFRRMVAKARKGLVRYGGAPGRLLAAAAPDSVPWSAAQRDSQFRDFVRDLLQAPSTKVTGLLPDRVVASLVDDGLTGAELYPLGLLMTLELTLRRSGAG